MKRILLSALLAAILLLTVASCDDGATTPTPGGDGAKATVTLDGDKITLSDTTAGTVDGSDLLITKGGTYTLSGKLNDGRITVEVDKEINVTLILSGAELNCSDSAPIFVKSAKNCYIELADGTTNKVVDGDTYVYGNALETEPNAAIFSKCDLIIQGSGALEVTGNFNNGIASKDDIEIKGGNLTVKADNNGIKGKDSVTVAGGNVNVEAAGDGIKSDDDKDPAKGFVQIDGGVLTLKTADEGIQATTNVHINGGTVKIESESNGIKANIAVAVNSGSVEITCASDGFDAPSVKGSATVNGETVTH